MSRVARNPVPIPAGVQVDVSEGAISIRGQKGAIHRTLHPSVAVTAEGKLVTFEPRSQTKEANAQAGTTRALVANMVKGVTEGFQKKLQLVGVGYRAQLKGGQSLNLSLGFSHPVDFAIPEGITVETPSATEILVRGIDRQQVGQVSANIRSIRPPEPYKGKGIRYADERISLKEAKKKGKKK